MIVGVINSGIHSLEKFEQVFELKEKYYLLKSYFLNDKKQSKCQWNVGLMMEDNKSFKVIKRLGSSEIYEEETGLKNFTRSAMNFLEKNS